MMCVYIGRSSRDSKCHLKRNTKQDTSNDAWFRWLIVGEGGEGEKERESLRHYMQTGLSTQKSIERSGQRYSLDGRESALAKYESNEGRDDK